MKEMSRRAFVGAVTATAASAVLVPATSLADEASPAEDFLFEEVDGLVAITGYVGQSEEVVVPRSINGSLVGLIWDGAFANKTAIFKVTLPKGVAYIGEGAFAGCISLEEIVLPERLVHIGARAFLGCTFLEEIELPDGLVEIGKYAFRGTSLARVVIPDGVSSVQKGTFPEGCELVRLDGSPVEVDSSPARATGEIDDTTGLPVVEFGSYPQDGDDPEPIEWLVLEERADGTALLLSRRCLATRRYHDKLREVTWEMCDLRAWTNGEFLRTAFTEEELGRIVLQTLENPDNPVFGTPGGADTADAVFCLSLQEIEALFGTKPYDADARLVAYPTERAVKEGEGAGASGVPCNWWLRSPGSVPDNAAAVSLEGSLSPSGIAVHVALIAFCVRPALVVEL